MNCTTAGLNVACFRGYTLSRLQKLAFKIWYMANELSVNGGTNYTNVLTQGPTSLRYAAKQKFDHWDRDAMDSAEVAITYNNAIEAGANVSNLPNTVIHQIPFLLNNIGEDDLMKMYIFLECALGVHRNPPA
jgi:hypothetical protein